MRTLLVLQAHSHSVLLHMLIVCSHEVASEQGAAYAMLVLEAWRLALSMIFGSQSLCLMQNENHRQGRDDFFELQSMLHPNWSLLDAARPS